MPDSNPASHRAQDDEVLVPLDELEAAWKEVEAATGQDTPTDQPHPADANVPSTADAGPPQTADTTGQRDATAPDASEPAQQPARSRRGGMRFVIGKRKQDAEQSEAAADETQPGQQAAATSPEPTGPEAAAAAGARDRSAGEPAKQAAARHKVRVGPDSFLPRVPWWKRLLRALDDLLDIINRPFASLSPQLRSLIGVVSLTTIIVSLASAWLIPTLMPHRDAITFLEEARARVLARQSTAASHSSPAASQTPATGNDAG